VAALAAATSAPARLLGRTDAGTLAPGGRADVIVLGDDLSLERVLLAGEAVEELAE
jgi:N-acetylglucosamine-6-phosphate deacetylase